MRISHLQDREIMAMLDGADRKGGRARTTALKHLKECNSCAGRAAEMVELYDQLASDPAPKLSPEFSAKVMKKIRQLESSRWEQWEMALSAFAPLTAAACALLLFDLQAVLDRSTAWLSSSFIEAVIWVSSLSWPEITIPNAESIDRLTTPLLSFLSENAELSSLLSALVLIVLLVSVADLPSPQVSRRSRR